MKEKQTMTLTQLFIEEYLEKKERVEELEKENHRLVRALKCAMNIVDDSRKMIDSLEIERAGENGEYIYVRRFLDKRDDYFKLFETELEGREKMKKKEEEKPEEKEEDHVEEVVEKDTEEETTNE